MLAQKTKYALKALLVLSEEYAGGPVLIADLAERGRVPRKFLELILLHLKNRGILGSRKGRGGGYYLLGPPREITLGAIIRALNGPLALLPCASRTAYRKCDDCPPDSPCGIQSVLLEVRDATALILDNTTLQDLLDRSQPGSPVHPIDLPSRTDSIHRDPPARSGRDASARPVRDPPARSGRDASGRPGSIHPIPSPPGTPAETPRETEADSPAPRTRASRAAGRKRAGARPGVKS